jgi:hypothetical protein
MKDRVEVIKKKCSVSNPLDPRIADADTNLQRAMDRLQAIAMTYREVIFSIRLVQRLWLELWALLDYLEIYEPRMKGHSTPGIDVADTIGCFVWDVRAAEMLYAAGIPYWYIRELGTFDTENILALTQMVQPHEVVELDDFTPAFPRIYEGDSNSNRFHAISNYCLNKLGYVNPFSSGNPRGINPSALASRDPSAAGPSRTVVSRTTAVHPCAYRM